MAAYMKLTKEKAKDYLQKGLWKPYIFSDFYERNAKQFPDDVALVDGETRLTWSELNLYADRAALGMVELGIARDTIMIEQTHDCWEHIVMRLAGEKAGIITLPLMRVLRHAEVEHLLNLTRTTSMVIPARFREFDYYQMLQDLKPKIPHLKHILVTGDEVPQGTISIREMVKKPLEKKYPPDYLKERRFRPEEIGTLTATTGTTGFPKVTQWPLTSQLTANEDHVKAWKMTKQDVCLSLAPLPGLGGTITYRCAPQVGARMVLLGHYTVEDAMKLMEKERATILGVVPTQLTGILSSPDFDRYDFSSVRIIRSSGGVTPPSLVDEAENRIKGCKVVISYGGTDYGSMTHMGVDSSAHARRYTVGHPVANLEIKFLDDHGKEAKEGVITVRGPCTSDGYFENPQATWEVWTKDGWGDTGDLGKLDDEGNLVILGRKKDMIIRGGQNVYPAEIERYLLGIPRIKDVAVIGMPDKLMGERVCAYIVLKPGEKPISFEEVIAHLKGLHVAPYKLPERVEIIDALPLAGGQKVDKKAIRADIVQKLKAEGKA